MRDITLEDTIYFNFTTRLFTTGVPATLTGGVLSALESNNATPITAGVSVQLDRNSITGLHQGTVVATAANGFEAGKSYGIYISTGTVSGVSVVGEVVFQFTIQASAAAVDLANATDGLGAIKTDTAAILVDTGTTLDARIPAALVSGRMDSSLGAIAAGVDLSATMKTSVTTAATAATPIAASVTGAVGSVNGAVGSVTGNVGGNVVGTVAGVTPAIAGAAMALTSAERNSTADALLARNVAGGSSAGRLVKEALYVLRNKTDISAGTLTVYGTDDTTSAFTAAVSTTAGNPISQIDPA